MNKIKKICSVLCVLGVIASLVSCKRDENNNLTNKKLDVSNLSSTNDTYVSSVCDGFFENVKVSDIIGINDENIIFNGTKFSEFSNFELITPEGKEHFWSDVNIENDTLDIIKMDNKYLYMNFDYNMFSGQMILKDGSDTILNTIEIDYIPVKAVSFPDNRIAVMYTDGVKIYNENLEFTETVNVYNDLQEVGLLTDICIDKNGMIYFLFWNKVDMNGSIYLRNESGEFCLVEDNLSSLGNKVENIFVDDDNNLVICGFEGGRCFVDVRKSLSGEVLSMSEIDDVIEICGITAEYGLIYICEEGVFGHNLSNNSSSCIISSENYSNNEIFDIYLNGGEVAMVVGEYTDAEKCIFILDNNENIIQKYPSSDNLISLEQNS